MCHCFPPKRTEYLILHTLICHRIKFEPPEIEYYQNDKELPIFSRVQCGYPIGDIVNILLKADLHERKVCGVQPLRFYIKHTYSTINANSANSIMNGAACSSSPSDWHSYRQNIAGYVISTLMFSFTY